MTSRSVGARVRVKRAGLLASLGVMAALCAAPSAMAQATGEAGAAGGEERPAKSARLHDLIGRGAAEFYGDDTVILGLVPHEDGFAAAVRTILGPTLVDVFAGDGKSTARLVFGRNWSAKHNVSPAYLSSDGDGVFSLFLKGLVDRKRPYLRFLRFRADGEMLLELDLATLLNGRTIGGARSLQGGDILVWGREQTGAMTFGPGYLARISESGEMLWMREIAGGQREWPVEAIKSGEGAFLAATSRGRLVRVGQAGEAMGESAPLGDDIRVAQIASTAEGLVVLGDLKGAQPRERISVLLMLGEDGAEQWRFVFDPSEDLYSKSMAVTESEITVAYYNDISRGDPALRIFSHDGVERLALVERTPDGEQVKGVAVLGNGGVYLYGSSKRIPPNASKLDLYSIDARVWIAALRR